MAGMRIEDLPRLNELHARSIDVRNSYFTPSLTEVLLTDAAAQKFFHEHEQNLGALSAEAWAQFLKKAMEDRVCVRREPVRANQPLFDFLNEAKAYVYLQRIGCKDIAFIAKAAVRTPDLQAKLEGTRVVCEVKSINRSDKDSNALSTLIRSVEWARGLRRRGVSVPQIKQAYPPPELGPEFYKKLTDRLNDAQAQIAAFCAETPAKKIVYLVFDADIAAAYERQIAQYLTHNPVLGLEIVLDMGRVS